MCWIYTCITTALLHMYTSIGYTPVIVHMSYMCWIFTCITCSSTHVIHMLDIHLYYTYTSTHVRHMWDIHLYYTCTSIHVRHVGYTPVLYFYTCKTHVGYTTLIFRVPTLPGKPLKPGILSFTFPGLEQAWNLLQKW